MRRKSTCFMVVCVVAATAVLFWWVQNRSAQDLPKQELQSLQGTWKVVEAQTIPSDARKRSLGLFLQITDQTLQMRDPANQKVLSTKRIVRLNSDTMPKQIYFVDPVTLSQVLAPNQQVRRLPAIYALDKDRLRLAFSPFPGEPRPTSFEQDPENPQHESLVLERVKK